MRKKHIKQMGICLIGLLVFMVSCRNQSPEPSSESSTGLLLSQKGLYTLLDHTIPQKAIEQEALSLMEVLTPSSLRGAERHIAEVVPLRDGTSLRATDSVDTSPLAYVINFADNKGYAVLSSDNRLNPVWAASPIGNLQVDKEPDNPTVRMLLEQVEVAYNLNRYTLESGNSKHIDHREVIGDTGDRIPPTPNLILTYTKYGPWENCFSDTHEAFIPVVWGQTDEPYNTYTKSLSDHAGCVTAAVAQIMAFHRHPSYYNWSLMLQHRPLANPYAEYGPAFSEIAKLYRDLSQSLKVEYRKEGGFVLYKNIPNTFLSFGYTHCNNPDKFSVAKIKQELQRGRGYPVHMSATDKQKVYYKYSFWKGWKRHIKYIDGHAFVIDGITRAKRLVQKLNKYTNKVEYQYFEYTDLLHANLGWDRPDLNGYYHPDVFDTRDGYGPILDAMSKASHGTEWVYFYNFEIITGIRP